MSLLKFSVSGKSASATKFVAKTRQFEIVIDEPPGLGGTDDAANPVEYLLASYAGCLNVVGHLVAQEQNLPLDGLEISIEGDVDPARLFGNPNAARAGYQGLEVRLVPNTTASPAQLEAWLKEVERRCPVNDNLSNSTPISVSVEPRLQQASAA
ncbi:MAG: OsmC family protein [Bacteroidota bacterium]